MTNLKKINKKGRFKLLELDQPVNTTGSALMIIALNGHGSETQEGHRAVASMDDADVPGKGKIYLC